MREEYELTGGNERVEHVFVKVDGVVRWITRDYAYNYVEECEELIFECGHDFDLADDGETIASNGRNWREWAKTRADRCAETRGLSFAN